MKNNATNKNYRERNPLYYYFIRMLRYQRRQQEFDVNTQQIDYNILQGLIFSYGKLQSEWIKEFICRHARQDEDVPMQKLLE